MPELPEVEVIRRRIQRSLVGRTIAGVVTTKPSYFFLTPPRVLGPKLIGRRLTGLERIGKYLLLSLDDGARLLLHLGMTGQLFMSGAASRRLVSRATRLVTGPNRASSFRPDRHTHLCLSFEDRGPELFFRDARKFGKCAYLPPGRREARLDKLGVDALSVTNTALYESARRRRIPIKSLLLDQSVLAGVGNIYADEALFYAGVRPTRRAGRVTREECVKIVRAVKRVLRRSIRAGGSSIDDYVQPDGEDGSYQHERRVYSRTGEPCSVCRTPIRRVVLGQRSSHYCPTCQT
jgi:formamidopyrimidine-DNA glycosylase